MLTIIEPDETFTLTIGESRLTLRRMSRPTLREIQKRHTRKVTEFVNHRPVQVPRVDDEAINDEVIDYVIVDWAGVRHPVTRAEVPCTRENKLKLPGRALARVLDACDADSAGEATDEPGEDPEGN